MIECTLYYIDWESAEWTSPVPIEGRGRWFLTKDAAEGALDRVVDGLVAATRGKRRRVGGGCMIHSLDAEISTPEDLIELLNHRPG